MYLYGASGHAKVIIDILEGSGIVVSGLFDDNLAVKEFFSKKVLGKYFGQHLDAPMIISIGNNKIRSRIADKFQLIYGNAIHSSAIVSSMTTIGEGTVIMHGSVIQAGTEIGKHSIVNTGASVDHDCLIGDFVHFSPGSILSGGVIVGEGTFIGSGAIVIPGVKIGKWCIIGAGAVVIRDIPDFSTTVGNPARIIKKQNNRIV